MKRVSDRSVTLAASCSSELQRCGGSSHSFVVLPRPEHVDFVGFLPAHSARLRRWREPTTNWLERWRCCSWSIATMRWGSFSFFCLLLFCDWLIGCRVSWNFVPYHNVLSVGVELFLFYYGFLIGQHTKWRVIWFVSYEYQGPVRYLYLTGNTFLCEEPPN